MKRLDDISERNYKAFQEKLFQQGEAAKALELKERQEALAEARANDALYAQNHSGFWHGVRDVTIQSASDVIGGIQYGIGEGIPNSFRKLTALDPQATIERHEIAEEWRQERATSSGFSATVSQMPIAGSIYDAGYAGIRGRTTTGFKLSGLEQGGQIFSAISQTSFAGAGAIEMGGAAGIKGLNPDVGKLLTRSEATVAKTAAGDSAAAARPTTPAPEPSRGTGQPSAPRTSEPTPTPKTPPVVMPAVKVGSANTFVAKILNLGGEGEVKGALNLNSRVNLIKRK